jgi:peptide/nickel transport system ATP-binding protein
MSLLQISGLQVTIGSEPILKGIDLTVVAGRISGIIGESGSGKTMTALSVMRLLPDGAVASGSVRLDGQDLLAQSEGAMCAVRGRQIGMVFQEPMSALDPLKTIGAQVAEPILVHGGVSRREAIAEADRVLARAGLPREAFPRDRFPHELSGGQRQRVVIAGAIAMRPKLLIADEPTTALDVTTQATIVELLRRLVDDDGMGLIFITHDLALVSGLADEVSVMRAGEVVEAGPTAEVFHQRTHAYTRQLFEASAHVPARDPALPGGTPVLRVKGVVRDYRLRAQRPFAKPRTFRALDGVSFTIGRGENLGLVGESGSGKSTLARAVLGLDAIQGGQIAIDGDAKVQAVFQDPYRSFDPRQPVSALVAEPFHRLGAAAPRGADWRARVVEALESVGLVASDGDKYIHEFSGGQRQRIAIARALIIAPRLIVLDEPVSALDVSIRAQILDLLAKLSDEREISYLFISHDLGVVRAITDRVLVMQAGQIVEAGKTTEVFAHPQHPYTRALLAATPRLEIAAA